MAIIVPAAKQSEGPERAIKSETEGTKIMREKKKPLAKKIAAKKTPLADLKPKKNPKGGLTFQFKLVAVKTVG